MAEETGADMRFPDPVFRDERYTLGGQVIGKWFFWDETWTRRCGPYDTEQEARQALVEYCLERDAEMERLTSKKEEEIARAVEKLSAFEGPVNEELMEAAAGLLIISAVHFIGAAYALFFADTFAVVWTLVWAVMLFLMGLGMKAKAER